MCLTVDLFFCFVAWVVGDVYSYQSSTVNLKRCTITPCSPGLPHTVVKYDGAHDKLLDISCAADQRACNQCNQ